MVAMLVLTLLPNQVHFAQFSLSQTLRYKSQQKLGFLPARQPEPGEVRTSSDLLHEGQGLMNIYRIKNQGRSRLGKGDLESRERGKEVISVLQAYLKLHASSWDAC